MFDCSLYQQLEFKQPEILVNPYGIKIYIGTKGEDDWAVVIPNKLCKVKHGNFGYDKDFVYYLITEERALEIAKEYTEIARRSKHGT